MTKREETLEEIRQRMNRERLREQEIRNRNNLENRRKRNHKLILLSAELLRFYNEETKKWVLEASDDEARVWIRNEMKKIIFWENSEVLH